MKWDHLKWLTVVLSVLVSIGALYVSVRFAGIIATIAYVFLFLMGAFGLPTLIGLFAPSFPRFMRGMLGKIHFMLGQFAFGYGYLVQREDKWEMCPGTADRVYIDGSWYDIEAGQRDMSVLGMRPFGMILEKTEETLRESRVDPYSLAQNAETDGGESVTRAGYTEAAPDATVSGTDGIWLIDLKRWYTQGIRKIGDISLIEKAEEVTMRKEAKASAVGGWEPVVGSIVGLVIGIATGYVLIGGV